ncbi:MAG: hypothetical protein LBG58_07875 [Planctomycetaceae bacterium]|jgi:class 3 adenylate cyclase|nr:hypothetical protein [Planctomycetaceae bacterium]
MMNEQFLEELKQLAKQCLQEALSRFKQSKDKLVVNASALTTEKRASIVKTPIPGHPSINTEIPEVGRFIALVADMRDSTDHLLRIEGNEKRPQKFERVFYETSVLLPVLARCIKEEKGEVIEYLGDGVLGLFYIPDDNEVKEYINHSYFAAQKCIDSVDKIINPLLETELKLPSLKIGIGMGYGDAIVTTIGLPENPIPKVIGECVYRASKLSDLSNKIAVDKILYDTWPKDKNGTLQFKRYSGKSKVEGYEIEVSGR